MEQTAARNDKQAYSYSIWLRNAWNASTTTPYPLELAFLVWVGRTSIM